MLAICYRYLNVRKGRIQMVKECRCDRLPEQDRPCFNCRWNVAEFSQTCGTCEAPVFWDHGAWRNDTGDQLCAANNFGSHKADH